MSAPRGIKNQNSSPLLLICERNFRETEKLSFSLPEPPNFFLRHGFFRRKKLVFAEKKFRGWFRGEKLVLGVLVIAQSNSNCFNALLIIHIFTYGLFHRRRPIGRYYSLLRHIFLRVIYVHWIFYLDRGMDVTVRVF